MTIEQKLDDNTRREIIRDWTYISAVASNPNQKVSIEGQELPVTYAQVALQKLADTAKSVKEKGYLEAILTSASSDLQQHGAYTKPTQQALESLAHGYSYALANSPIQEVAGLARELGYKDSLPEFLLSYKGTFENLVKENAEKAKSGDEKAKAVMSAVQLIQQILGIKAKDNLRDYLLGQNFKQLDEVYKHPELVAQAREREQARVKAKEKSAKKPEQEEEE